MVCIEVIEKTEERRSVVLENNGEKIFGVLHLPIGVAKAPVVLVCHGLAGNKTGRHRVYVDLATQLAKEGIATLRFDYRGCGDSEGTFYETTLEGYYSDAGLCLDYLKNHPRIDASRIGIYGCSFGGAVAVKTASQEGAVKAMSLWCPIFSGREWLQLWQEAQTTGVDEKLIQEMMCVNGQQGSREFFKDFFHIDVRSDLMHLQYLPLLHVHGESDTRVSLQHAGDYASCRQKSAAPTKFIRLPNTDHAFSHAAERSQAIEETLKWFAKHL